VELDVREGGSGHGADPADGDPRLRQAAGEGRLERLTCWLGVDVGGPRKGFDVALVRSDRLTALRARQSVASVVGLVRDARPAVVAIDSPRSCAPPGATSRDDERALRRGTGVGIRWTPDREEVEANPYYDWVVEGLRLYEALAAHAPDVEVIECFPTAAWTRWHGPRGHTPRSAWSAKALATRGLDAVPDRLGQDQRDAIGAALVARAHDRGQTQAFGEIVVPR
jgi:predicted nuclease with RNAse H fold